MKKKAIQITMMAALLLSGSQLFANKTQVLDSTVMQNDSIVKSFKVYGNCGMCKGTIEGSLKEVEGVYSAVWDKETKMILVNYNESLISLDDIKKKITSVGYDTEELRATDKAYKGLHGCCQYERPEKK